jgi:hypothetical protein
MSEQYSHLTGGPAVPLPPSRGREEPRKPRGKGFRKVVLWTAGIGTAVVIGAGAVGVATNGSTSASTADPRPAPTASNPFSDSDPSNDPNYQPSGSGDSVSAANNSGVSEDPAPAQPTVSQEQALESAQGYLDMGTGFSRAGLIDQLHSSAGEGFPMTDAKWAVNHTHANWNHQAVLSAKGYLDMGGFSRASLIDQLSSSAGEGFTVAQATYAANQVGL